MSKSAVPDPIMELCGASPVTCLCFEKKGQSNEESVLISGHQNGKILFWNLKFQRVAASMNGHEEAVIWISSPKTDIMISQGREGLLKVWSGLCSTWKLLGQISTALHIFCNSSILDCTDHYLIFTPVEESGAVSSYRVPPNFMPCVEQRVPPNFMPCVEQAPSYQCCHCFVPTPQKTYGMCMRICTFKTNTDKNRLLVAYESGSLSLWDAQTCTLLSTVQAHLETVMCLDICATKNPEALKAMTGSVDTDLKSWLVTENTLTQDRSVSVTNPGLSSLASRTDGRIFASGGWDGLCRVFTVSKLKPLVVLSNHKESIQCVTFFPDNRLATGSKDGYITLWDVYSDK